MTETTYERTLNRVARRADTEGVGIDAAETRRVVACLMRELAKMHPADVAEVLRALARMIASEGDDERVIDLARAVATVVRGR